MDWSLVRNIGKLGAQSNLSLNWEKRTKLVELIEFGKITKKQKWQNYLNLKNLLE